MSSFRRPLKITRKYGVPELKANGEFREQETYTLTGSASVQPMRANEMQALPEGRRGYRAVKVYSDTELWMANQMTGRQADTFTWLGVKFEVVASDQYMADVISHYTAYATEATDH